MDGKTDHIENDVYFYFPDLLKEILIWNIQQKTGMFYVTW